MPGMAALQAHAPSTGPLYYSSSTYPQGVQVLLPQGQQVRGAVLRQVGEVRKEDALPVVRRHPAVHQKLDFLAVGAAGSGGGQFLSGGCEG